MNDHFFERPILNSPYAYPARHWELDASGQPTQQITERRRRAEFITPIPKPKKRKGAAQQASLIFDEGKGLSTKQQQYDHTAIINSVRQQVDQWRRLPSPNDHRDLLGPGREQPRHARPLGVRRVQRGLPDRSRLQGQGGSRVRQDDRARGRGGDCLMAAQRGDFATLVHTVCVGREIHCVCIPA